MMPEAPDKCSDTKVFCDKFARIIPSLIILQGRVLCSNAPANSALFLGKSTRGDVDEQLCYH